MSYSYGLIKRYPPRVRTIEPQQIEGEQALAEIRQPTEIEVTDANLTDPNVSSKDDATGEDGTIHDENVPVDVVKNIDNSAVITIIVVFILLVGLIIVIYFMFG